MHADRQSKYGKHVMQLFLANFSRFGVVVSEITHAEEKQWKHV
jgi:hypothetical protein